MKRIGKDLILGLAFLCLIGNGGCGSGSRKLSGSGSTFIKPIMDKWIEAYTQEKDDLDINYQSAGSTAGIKQMTDRAVDFGCTDAFMTEEQLQLAVKHGGAVVHIPLVLGAIVPAYNVNVDRPIRFSGEVLARIFLGDIKKWNDPSLQKLNPDVKLPDLNIAVVHRTEGSGSTFLFTSYLQKVSMAWQLRGIGAGAAVNWKTGVGEQGNPGLAGFLSQTKGSIGYIELYYALLKKDEIQFGAVQNRDGKFIRADLRSVTAAAENALLDKKRITEDLFIDLLDAPGMESYPISGATWAVYFVDQEPLRGKALVDFFTWSIHEGQKYNENMHYARLPEALVQRIDDKLRKIKK